MYPLKFVIHVVEIKREGVRDEVPLACTPQSAMLQIDSPEKQIRNCAQLRVQAGVDGSYGHRRRLRFSLLFALPRSSTLSWQGSGESVHAIGMQSRNQTQAHAEIWVGRSNQPITIFQDTRKRSGNFKCCDILYSRRCAPGPDFSEP
jgi:hypothetical protein